MEKIAFLFPGQGSQFAGMGKALADAYPSSRQVFEEADQTLGFALSKLCFEGPDEDLKLTQNTQPAMLTVSMAALAALRDNGVAPDYVAGHSLGEFSALVAAGGRGLGSVIGTPTTSHRYNLTIGMSVRNLLNHTNPGPIIGNITSPLFGFANQVAGGPNGEGFYETANNRRLESQIRFTF